MYCLWLSAQKHLCRALAQLTARLHTLPRSQDKLSSTPGLSPQSVSDTLPHAPCTVDVQANNLEHATLCRLSAISSPLMYLNKKATWQVLGLVHAIAPCSSSHHAMMWVAAAHVRGSAACSLSLTSFLLVFFAETAGPG